MVSYDLPWNPNRIERRFGRIHRIGQPEVCRRWNFVAGNTREGEVFTRLLAKIEEQRKSYGGTAFDVLGTAFAGTPLRKLLIEAIRGGAHPARDAGATRATPPDPRTPRRHGSVCPVRPRHAQPGDLGAHDRRRLRCPGDRPRGFELRSA
jgi:hypothetical protein